MFICQPLVIMISNTISESQQQMKSSPQHRTQTAFPQPWALPATRVHAPLILLLMLFFSTLSPLSPPPSSAASRAKNSSKFSPSTLAKPKLLNFNVPGPSNSICERSEKKPFQKQTELKHSSVLFTFNYLIRRGGEKQRQRCIHLLFTESLPGLHWAKSQEDQTSAKCLCTWAIICCLPGCTCRKLDQKPSTQDSN